MLGVGVGIVCAQQARVELREEVGAAAALQRACGWGVRLRLGLRLLGEGVCGRVGVVVGDMRREGAARDWAVDVRLLELVLVLVLAWTFPALVLRGVGHCGGLTSLPFPQLCSYRARLAACYARPTADVSTIRSYSAQARHNCTGRLCG